jgi:hypothetical protein
VNHRIIWIALLCLCAGCGGCGEDSPGGNGGDAGPDQDTDSCIEGQLLCDEACVSVVDDPLHCGSCDPCPTAPDATAFCVVSQCELACADGFGDADGDLEDPDGNGCECATTGAEVCDGVDNDCDGDTDGEDDDLDLTVCAQLAGAEATRCSDESECVYSCADGFRDGNGDIRDGEGGNGCECPAEVAPEVCDGIDNDCDGATDEGGPDLLSLCVDLPNALVRGCAAGACTYTCKDGFGDANGDLALPDSDGCECTATDEICDGVDNDCDGAVDGEDPDFEAESVCAAVEGAVAGCDGRCTWTCAEGRGDVDGDLMQGPQGTGCECTTTGPEVCDGADNDCDGLIDTDDEDVQLMLCPNQDGVCIGAAEICVEGQLVECSEQRYADHAEDRGWVFDGLGGIELGCDDNSDNNCNGATDENCCREGREILSLTGPENDDRRQIAPAIAVNGAGDRILVAWQETLDTEDDEASFQGTVRWAVFGLDGTEYGGHTVTLVEGATAVQPAAAWDGSTFVVGYVIHSDQLRFLRTTRVDDDGSSVGGAIVFNDASGTITDVAISGRGDGSYVVAWTFMRRAQFTPVCNWEAAESCIQFAVVDTQNEVSPFEEISPAAGVPFARRPSAAFGERDGIVVWQRLDADPGRIVSARIEDGTLVARHELSQSRHRPPVTFAGAAPTTVRTAGGFLVAHEDFVEDTIQVVIRRLDVAGAPVGQPVVATNGNGDKRFPQLVRTGDSVGLVWSEGDGVGFQPLSELGVPVGEPEQWFTGRRIGFEPVRGTPLFRTSAWVDSSGEGAGLERLHLRIVTQSGDLRCAPE